MAREPAQREGKLNSMSFRATDSLKERLKRSASRKGRSVTSDIEMRLEMSLDRDEADEIRFAIESDEATRQLCRLCSIAANMVATFSRGSIANDRDVRDAVFHAIAVTLAKYDISSPLLDRDPKEQTSARKQELKSFADSWVRSMDSVTSDPAVVQKVVQGMVDQLSPYAWPDQSRE